MKQEWEKPVFFILRIIPPQLYVGKLKENLKFDIPRLNTTSPTIKEYTAPSQVR